MTDKQYDKSKLELWERLDESLNNRHLPNIDKFIALSPDLFQGILKPFNTAEEKLIVFAALVAITGGVIPCTYFIYDKRKTFVQIMIFIAAPPSSGKGVLYHIKDLVSYVDDELMAKRVTAVNKYKADYDAAVKQKRKRESYIVPEAPHTPLLTIPGNITSPALIQQLMHNGADNCLLIFELEGDIWAYASKSEHAQQNNTIIRSVFHNETVSQYRKKENELLEARNPKVSVVLSGTPDQLKKVFYSNENGLFSRFLIITYTGLTGFKKVFADDNDEESVSLNEYFAGFKSTYYELWKYFRNHEVEVRFTTQQKHCIQSFGERNYAHTHNFIGQYADSIPKRHANILARIAATICMVRYFENKEKLRVIYCTDDDISIAQWIAEISITNSLNVFQQLPGERINELHQRKKLFWDQLPEKFTIAEISELLTRLNISERSLFRWLKVFCDTGMLTHISQGQYQKQK